MAFRTTHDAGAFGSGGQKTVAQRLTFFGRLGEEFAAFALDRAARLGLTGWMIAGAHRTLVHIEGPEALAGAFEVACCIGPDACLVSDWTCEDTAAQVGLAGFSLRT